MLKIHAKKINLFVADSLRVARALKENSVDAIVTDPPYVGNT